MTSGRRYLVIPRAVVVSGQHLLLVREAAGHPPPSPGRWHLPGGEVLAGESPQKAAQRIVKGTSGLELEVCGCLDALARRGKSRTTGRAVPLLHLFFLCRPGDAADPALLPNGTDSPQLEQAAAGPTPPPGGSAWGWTDLASGLAALKHDVVGPAVIQYLQSLQSS